jgi:ATP-dependent DNA helicase RecG
MTTTLEQFDIWLKAPREIEALEFKEAKNQYDNTKLLRYCVAISNEGGGKLILGVTDAIPRQVVGTAAFNNPQGIQRKILNTLGFLVKVECLDHTSGRVVIFHIPSRDRGTARQLDGAFWMRSGEDLVPMTPERLREIFDEGKPEWLMRIARAGCSASDVVLLLDTQTYYDLLKQAYPTTRTTVLERLESEKLIFEDGHGYSITNLGAVLFGKRLDEFEGLERKAPRVIVYDGPHKLENSRVFQPGSKGYAVGFLRLIDFII